jgi:hypothetical protein
MQPVTLPPVPSISHFRPSILNPFLPLMDLLNDIPLMSEWTIIPNLWITEGAKWRGHHHQWYIHTYTSIYFANTTWSYYSRSCSLAYPSSKFTLKLMFIRFWQWRHVHSCFTQEQWIGSKGKRHRAGWIRTAGQPRLVTAAHNFIWIPFYLFKYFL